MKFLIDRTTWRRGGDMNNPDLGLTRLLNKKGYMCCLGQIAHQCGVPEQVMLNMVQPNEIPAEYIMYRSLLTIGYKNNDLALAAMGINDNKNMTDAQREQMLINLFASHGHELEFVSVKFVIDSKCKLFASHNHELEFTNEICN